MLGNSKTASLIALSMYAMANNQVRPPRKMKLATQDFDMNEIRKAKKKNKKHKR